VWGGGGGGGRGRRVKEGGGEGVERSRKRGGRKDGRGGCGKDGEADPTYPQPRYSPQNGEITLERETR